MSEQLRQYRRGGLVFEVSDEGPPDGDPVVLLHGFPQDATTWKRVAPQLHAAGLRTLAPDQRGYSPGARPSSRSAYQMSELVADVIALLDAAELDRAHVVGHDWGGAVAWAVANGHRDRVASLTVLSTPHPGAMLTAMRSSSQALKSWYMFLFQLPWLPEVVAGPRMKESLTSSGLPDQDAEHYAARLAAPGALTAALNWYRGMPWSLRSPGGRIRVPTTYVWGSRDFALGRKAAELTQRYVAADYRFEELDAGHWLPEKHPDQVADLVIERVTAPIEGE